MSKYYGVFATTATLPNRWRVLPLNGDGWLEAINDAEEIAHREPCMCSVAFAADTAGLEQFCKSNASDKALADLCGLIEKELRVDLVM